MISSSQATDGAHPFRSASARVARVMTWSCGVACGGLRRCDLDLDARTVRVTRQLTELRGGGHQFGPPKSKAGLRTVPIPELIIPIIRWHLACFALDGDEGLTAAGLKCVHFHDLRHTGNTLAANADANLRELMDRMGHDSVPAALIYLPARTRSAPTATRTRDLPLRRRIH